MDHKDIGLLKNYQFLSSYTKLEKMISLTIIIHFILYICLYSYGISLMAYSSAVWFQEGVFIFIFISAFIVVCKFINILSLKLCKNINPSYSLYTVCRSNKELYHMA